MNIMKCCCRDDLRADWNFKRKKTTEKWKKKMWSERERPFVMAFKNNTFTVTARVQTKTFYAGVMYEKENNNQLIGHWIVSLMENKSVLILGIEHLRSFVRDFLPNQLKRLSIQFIRMILCIIVFWSRIAHIDF